MSDQSNQPQTTLADMVSAGIKIGAEAVVPGGSNIVKGDLGTGLVHAAVGFGAKMFIGGPALVVVSLNSLAKAFTGRGLLSHLGFHSPDDRENPLRVVAKEGIKTGKRIGRGVRNAGARATEGIQDIVAEAESELEQESPGGGERP